MTPEIVNGWLVVPCGAHDMARVEVGISPAAGRSPRAWTPAFRDWHHGQRVAQARCVPPKAGNWSVWLRVDGRVTGPHRLVVK